MVSYGQESSPSHGRALSACPPASGLSAVSAGGRQGKARVVRAVRPGWKENCGVVHDAARSWKGNPGVVRDGGRPWKGKARVVRLPTGHKSRKTFPPWVLIPHNSAISFPLSALTLHNSGFSFPAGPHCPHNSRIPFPGSGASCHDHAQVVVFLSGVQTGPTSSDTLLGTGWHTPPGRLPALRSCGPG